MQRSPPDIVALFRTFKPSQGGNDLIWAVNKVANANKHAGILEPVAGTVGNIHFRDATFSKAEFYSKWNPEKNEIEFASIEVGSQAQYDSKGSLGVVFSEIEAVRGQPPEAFLTAATTEFGRIVDAIEAEAKRLGIIK